MDVQAQLRDPEGKPLRIKWELLPESTDIRAGGDFERRPTALSLSISGDPETGFSFKAPRTKGSYRLFVYAFDEGGTAVAANFPFYVD